MSASNGDVKLMNYKVNGLDGAENVAFEDSSVDSNIGDPTDVVLKVRNQNQVGILQLITKSVLTTDFFCHNPFPLMIKLNE